MWKLGGNGFPQVRSMKQWNFMCWSHTVSHIWARWWWEEVGNVQRALESEWREEEAHKKTIEPWSHGFCPFQKELQLWGLELVRSETWARTWRVKMSQWGVHCFGLEPLIAGVNRGSQRCAGLDKGKDDSIQIEVRECWGPGACWDFHYWASRLGDSWETMPCKVWEARGLERGREGLASVPLSTSLH